MKQESSLSFLQELGSPPLPTTATATSSLVSCAGSLDAQGICAHAVAHGSHVIGIGSDGGWTWSTSLDPHPVQSLISNQDGSVIVVAAEGGNVSLLRGCDGRVVLTRQLAVEQGCSLSGSAVSLTWITDPFSSSPDTTVLMEIPQETGPPHILLVRHIDSIRCNGTTEEISDAIQSMEIQSIVTERDLADVSGLYRSQNIIRFVARDVEGGSLVAFDYCLHNRAILNDSWEKVCLHFEEEWQVEPYLRYQPIKIGDQIHFLCAASRDSHSAIFYLDPISLRGVCRFPLPFSSSQVRSKIMGLTTVASLNPQDATAFCIAEKVFLTKKSVTRLYVVQVGIEETLGLTLLSKPHIVYTIPALEHNPIALSLAPLNIASHPYTFRFKAWRSMHKCSYHQFQPACEGLSRFVGGFRLLLSQERYDDADALCQHSSYLDAALSDPFAQFSPAEVSLDRLISWLNHGDMATSGRAQQFLQNIAEGAKLNNRKGRFLLLEAVKAVFSTTLTLEQLVFAIQSVSLSLQDVIKYLGPDDAQALVAAYSPLEERLVALRVLMRIGDVKLSTPFNQIESVSQLYYILVREGKFDVAERFCRNGGLQKLSLEALVSPLLVVDESIPPSTYIPMIRDMVMPQLFSYDGLLNTLRSWSCRVADALDDCDQPGRDLNAAIELLRTIDSETRKLRIKMYSSFSSFSPFVERPYHGRKRPSPRSANSTLTNSADSTALLGSFKERNFDPSCIRQIPTILELGVLRGGATKSIAAAVSENSEEDDMQFASDQCVENKLREALCLQKARQLGYDKRSLSLRNFMSAGDAIFVATELIRIYSVSSPDHESRQNHLISLIQPFCEEFGVCFDDALFSCTTRLCKTKPITERSIEEAASLARCCPSVVMKCKAAHLTITASLLCERAPDWLAELSQDAILWAACDPTLKSELEEASRLLSIDRIVVRYCGIGAKELFCVDDERHSERLLHFVTKHVTCKSVVEDAMALCDAFHHLQPDYAGVSILTNALLLDDSTRLTQLLEEIFQHNHAVAQSVLIQTLNVADCMLQERADGITDAQQLSVAESVLNLIDCAMVFCKSVEPTPAAILNRFVSNGSLEIIRNRFLRILRLERDHAIYASLSKLNSPWFRMQMASKEMVTALERGDSPPGLLKTEVTSVKRACALLAGDSKSNQDVLWNMSASFVLQSQLSKVGDLNQAMEVADMFGLLSPSEYAAVGQIVVALALCRASLVDNNGNSRLGMERICSAVSLLRDWALRSTFQPILSLVVSLSSVLDLVYYTLTRSDEGMGECLEKMRRSLQTKAWQLHPSTPFLGGEGHFAIVSCVPKLQPHWYVGDGLLLPPQEALDQSLRFSKSVLFSREGDENAAAELFEFICERGSHSLALRVLSCWVSMYLARNGQVIENMDFSALRTGFEGIKCSLAERSLGGSGAGITNATVDSELAVSFLLSLPIELAFKTYKASLPTAVKTCNFEKTLCLANVGCTAASGRPHSRFGSNAFKGWRGQSKFLEQCRKLALFARWSKLLSYYGIEFDPHLLREDKLIASSRESVRYSSSLIPAVITGFSKTVSSVETYQLTSLFARDFDINPEVIQQKRIEYLLAPVAVSSVPRKEALVCRQNLERNVACSLRLLTSWTTRCSVLRRCLVALEGAPSSSQDYELFALALNLYRLELSKAIDEDCINKDIERRYLIAELDAIDRRRDALTILSSFYVDDKEKWRPSFPDFFVRLTSSDLFQDQLRNHPLCGVLGQDNRNCFDPLKPLEQTLQMFPGSGTVTALAPLCIPLGLPVGYIHARSLIMRFSVLSQANCSWPAFDNDVLPVCDRLKSSRDKAVLAEWCSKQYRNNDEEKLKCLDLALKSCMQASAEIERINENNVGSVHVKQLEQLESELLESVKRLSYAKEVLSDCLRIKTALRSNSLLSKGSVSRMIDSLILEIDQQQDSLSTETLISFLLEKSSSLFAIAAVERQNVFSIDERRNFIHIVYEACNSVADYHSHINPSHIARRYARRWLFYGDDSKSNTMLQSGKTIESKISSIPDNSNDTDSFVMDIADIQTSDTWGLNVAETAAYQLTSEEEPSAIHPLSSREISETTCLRAALRISFMLAAINAPADVCSGGKENSGSGIDPLSKVTKKRRGLLVAIETKRDKHLEDKMYEICRELLSIVFAAKGSTVISKMPISLGHCAEEKSLTTSGGNAYTFAMRHRAFRVASILCPQEVLEDVVKSDGYLSCGPSGSSVSLMQCTFGAFIAKEIEEMGLPLPHDDLGRLSSMHFLSYARTLWRHHWGNQTLCKGRLLLLLVDMSLKEIDTDIDFIESIMKEIVRLQLPRTLLLALECLNEFAKRSSARSVDYGLSLSSFTAASALGNHISAALNGKSCDDIENSRQEITLTIERFYIICCGFQMSLNTNTYLEIFLETASTIRKGCFGSDLLEFVDSLANQVKRLIAV